LATSLNVWRVLETLNVFVHAAMFEVF